MTTTTIPRPTPDRPAAEPDPTDGLPGSASGAPVATPPPRRAGRIERWVRGPADDPSWARPALFALLAATAVLYLWDLSASGWANTYYSAAVQAATKSWKAFFFGSSDASNFITVDKSPVFLWPMDLAARVFGLNSWTVLAPQALEGVAAVGILYAAVKRWFGASAGLLAGAVMALTPVAALMFRFNNPDAMLTLLLTAGAYATVRAVESGRTRWLVLAGSLVGFGFLAKMLQAFLVVPAFALVYLVAGPASLRRRIGQVLAAGAALVASALWWVLAVELWPASSRPYIGGSQNNSLWNLIFGYNGFGRLTGAESGSVGGGQGTAQWGPTGWTRLFNAQFGGQASWLLPAALVFGMALLVFTRRTPRTGRTRAAVLLWGGWLFVTGAAISLGQGIIHPYYTVALAPAIGALVGIGAVSLWQRRQNPAARMVLAGATVATVWWSFELLGRTPSWHPAVRSFVLVAGLGATVALVVLPVLTRAAALVAAVALAASLAGPAAYTLATVSTAHGGALPSAGPAVAGGFGPGGPGGAGGRLGGPPGAQTAGGQAALGAPPGRQTAPTGGRFGGPGGPGAAGAGGGGDGGILNGSTPSAELTSTLQQQSTGFRWVAATVSANQAAGYQLASGDAVMAIGGFNGTDPAPTLAQFQAYVADGDIHYFIAGGQGPGGGGPGGAGGTSASSSSSITTWVESHFSSTTVGGVTLYDLTAPVTS